MRKYKTAFLPCFYFLLLIGVCSISHADDWSDKVHFNAYFTLDLSVANTDISTVNSADGVRIHPAHDLNIKNSLFGGQFQFEITDNLSLFGQGIAFYDQNDHSETNINWAYLSYDFNNDLHVRTGLFQTPLMQGTELRSIGYSRLWARPLIPGSGASGINEYHGINILKNLANGNYNWEVQFALGKGEHGLSMVDVDDMQLIATKVTHGQFWLRAALMRAEYDFYTPLGDLILESTDIRLASIETEFELANITFNLGASRGKGDGIPRDTMQYLSAAYQLNDVTPFIFFTKASQEFIPFSQAQRPQRQTPPNRRPPAFPRPSSPDGKAISYNFGAGLRWNVTEQFALKIQYQHIRKRDDTGRIDSIPNNSGNVFSFVIDGAF